MFSSPIVFTHNDTSVGFTSINRSVIIEITIVDNFLEVFIRDFITHVNHTVTVGIGIGHVFINNMVDIFTRPSTFTPVTFVWGHTVEVFRFWAVFISPSVFTSNNTVVDFTSVKNLIIVLVTVFKEDF